MLPNKLMNKWVITLLAAVLALSVLSACGKKSDTGADQSADQRADQRADQSADPNVVATYKDNGTITRAEFDAFVNVNKMFDPQLASYITDPMVQQEILKQLMVFKIMSARADEATKKEGDKQVADQMTQMKDYLSKLEGGLDKQLADNQVKLEDIENLLKMNFYTMLSLENKVTDQQVQETYNTNSAAHAYDFATVSHILISTKDAATQADIRTLDQALVRANEVVTKLKSGGDFAALAKEYSDDPGSKDKGGTYPDANVNQWVPEFKEATISLPLNTISEPPVKSDFGYHVMKVESRTTKKLDEVKPQIKSEIANKALMDFVTNELPGMIETNKLPKPEDAAASPAASPAASVSPSASPAAK